MFDVRSQGGSNRETLEVSGFHVQSLDDIAMYVKWVTESAPPLFLAIVGLIFVGDWTEVMSHNYKFLSIPNSLRVEIAYMFMMGEPALWVEHVGQLRMYRWNKFRSLLERSFRSLGADWDRRMINQFWNSTDDLVRVVLADVRAQAPQMPQAKMLEVMTVTRTMRKIPRRILRKRLMGLKPRVGCSP